MVNGIELPDDSTSTTSSNMSNDDSASNHSNNGVIGSGGDAVQESESQSSSDSDTTMPASISTEIVPQEVLLENDASSSSSSSNSSSSSASSSPPSSSSSPTANSSSNSNSSSKSNPSLSNSNNNANNVTCEEVVVNAAASSTTAGTTLTTNTTTTTAGSTSGSSTSTTTPSATTAGGATPTGAEQPPITTDTRRRVKLYMLNANRTWDDRGTGHVSSGPADRLNGTALMVKAETDGSLLLESRILADTAYQKQQDTLIVWSEGENYDLALSFQERVGCEEIWAKICQVQGKDPSVDITQDIMEDEDNDLPPCEVDRLDEINSILASSLTMQSKKDSVTLALETENYISKLLQLFRQLEERKDVPSLQKMYDIFKNIFMLNRNSLFDIMLSDEALWDVIGVFEYDPLGAAVKEGLAAAAASASTSSASGSDVAEDLKKKPSTSSAPPPVVSVAAGANRALNANSFFTSLPSSSETDLMRLIREKRHREFLRNVSRFKEVIPLSKSDLVAKIHQTYRVQYIQDVILPTPSVFEDNMLSTLSSFIFFNKVEIVSQMQQDDKFLKELFRQLADDTPSFQEKRRDLVLFLKELCTFSHTLQLQNRELFIKTLSSLGLLHTLELLLAAVDGTVKLGAVDILTYIVDYSPSMVREYALQQELNSDKTEKYIINIIIEQMICDTDPDLGMATQLSNILKLLIDPENMLTASGMNKSEKSEFLNYFYKHCIFFLTEPILAATVVDATADVSTQQRVIDYRLGLEQSCQSAQLLAIILELLTFCIEHHAYHIRSYLLSKDVVRRIMVLTKSKHTFLVLSVIRFVRRLVGLKDEFYNRHIMTANLFAPIIDSFLGNKGRYNLLDSAVIDLFEFIHSNSILTLCNYTIDTFWKGKLERVDYVRTFKCMKQYYDQQNAMKDRIDTQNLLFTRQRFRRDPRQLEKEEDMWFNGDDEEEEEECADDDDEDDCENFHDDDEDSPPHGSRLLSSDSTVGAGGHFVGISYGATGSSVHKAQSSSQANTSSATSSSTSASNLQHSLHHTLTTLSQQQQQLQQQSSGVSSTTTNLSGVSGNYGGGGGNGAGGGGGHLASGSVSQYGDSPSAFIDSPFFSFAANQKRVKMNERKTLTINLNTSKSSASSYLASSGVSSPSGLSAFTSQSLSSSTSLVSTSNHHHHSSSSTSSTSYNIAKSFTSSSVLMGSGATGTGVVPLSLCGVNADGSFRKDSLQSRKALVDYPDEDSDEDDEEDVPNEDDLEEEEEEDDLLKSFPSTSSTTSRLSTSGSNALRSSKHLFATSSSPSSNSSVSQSSSGSSRHRRHHADTPDPVDRHSRRHHHRHHHSHRHSSSSPLSSSVATSSPLTSSVVSSQQLQQQNPAVNSNSSDLKTIVEEEIVPGADEDDDEPYLPPDEEILPRPDAGAGADSDEGDNDPDGGEEVVIQSQRLSSNNGRVDPIEEVDEEEEDGDGILVSSSKATEAVSSSFRSSSNVPGSDGGGGSGGGLDEELDPRPSSSNSNCNKRRLSDEDDQYKMSSSTGAGDDAPGSVGTSGDGASPGGGASSSGEESPNDDESTSSSAASTTSSGSANKRFRYSFTDAEASASGSGTAAAVGASVDGGPADASSVASSIVKPQSSQGNNADDEDDDEVEEEDDEADAQS